MSYIPQAGDYVSNGALMQPYCVFFVHIDKKTATVINLLDSSDEGTVPWSQLTKMDHDYVIRTLCYRFQQLNRRVSALENKAPDEKTTATAPATK